ncbi:hypothetical protein [Wenzhouxiangella marina]|uniref:Uncharacterized protein n=1 Tax=Wenzhouxiangella marina TaxID=1579979 RepID=A0A0K0XVG0_9GAMM|nr:hypothetical protein [Wenzhouxiangella marina]AKS41668.1 hypothetical protein WM2015_1295 [Wenzhouxiangella marina]MBB6086571.1 hypothetical protein [Wenzhouxiangella marina]
MQRKFVWIVVIAAALWLTWPARFEAGYSETLASLGLPAPRPGAGPSIEEPPLQRLFESPQAFRAEDLEIRLRAEFQVAARILSRRDYRGDNWASLAPIDLALGWGPMSDPEVLEQIEISQRGRFYFWRVDQFPIPRAQIEQSSANMHLIPGSPELFERLKTVEASDRILLRGFLVDIDRDDGYYWRTSTRRTDTGNGACELLLVTDFEPL